MSGMTTYDVAPEILEWLNHNLSPLEGSVFRHYRGIINLVRVVDAAERGDSSMFMALAAIRSYNEDYGTSITYDEIKERSSTYVFSEIGDWVAYTESQEASNAIVTGEDDDPLEALTNADPDILWIVLWLPKNEEIIVLRSPYEQNGHYTLPPEVEASVGSMKAEELEMWSR